MDESICLDDELLSPMQEAAPPISPLAQLDTIIQEDEETRPSGVAPGVSMDNILLETSPTMESLCLGPDEESDTSEYSAQLTSSRARSSDSESRVTVETEVTDLSTALPSAEPEPLVDESSKIEAIPEGVEIAVSVDHQVIEKVSGSASQDDLSKTRDKDGTAPARPADISSYFVSPNLDPTEASFFDDISSAHRNSVNSTYGEDDEVSALTKQRTLSLGSSGSATEATTVSFEQSQGSGMKFVGSMQNVSKFFTEEGTGGNDFEGKSFFDTFTAADGEEAVINVAASPKPEAGMRLSQSAGVGSITLPSTSPHPSPLHLPRSRTTSLTSPMTSPVHMIHCKEPPLTMSPETVHKQGDVLQRFPSGEDPFFASLNMSDMDRRNDAWLPSDATRQALLSMVSGPATQYPDTDQLTRPGIIVDEPLGDPVRELVQKYMGDTEANKRVTLNMKDVPQNEEGIRKLISAECYRCAIDLSGQLITQVGQGPGKLGAATKHTPYTLQLWFTRLALQMKLRLYNHAESEIQAFGSLDRPDLYYEYYTDSYPGRKGSMVPFEMRVLCAELPQYSGKPQESLDMLHYIQGVCQTIITNLSLGLAEDGGILQLSNDSRRQARQARELWEKRHLRVLFAIGNCLLNIKDYQTAVTIFEGLFKHPDVDKAPLQCGIGRIYLQMGDISSAEIYFLKAEACSDSTQPKVRCMNLMNKGFVSLGNNHFAEAHGFFEEAVNVEPNNAVAVNNMAVCSLYMGKLKEALSTLEQLIHTDPSRFLQEGLLFNLCTLYELESSRAIHKKQALLDLVSKYKGNGFNTACLKIQ